nr:nephrin-like [Cherax quadricarinatus]
MYSNCTHVLTFRNFFPRPYSVDYREQAGGRPQVWRDNTASTARRAYLHLAGTDVGVAEGIDPSLTATRVADMGFGDGLPTHLGEGMSSRIFGNVLDDLDSLGNEIDSGGRESAGEDDLEDESVGLVVRDVELNDSAVYRCRVDFLLTPTRNTRVNLTVVVPPQRVGVRWWMGERGDPDIDSQVGPFREGDSPSLVCYTRDAWPPPRVVWFEDDMLVDDTYAMDASNEAMENTITLQHLTRAHHRRRFTCVVANSNLTRPIAATVHIQMALDVLSVEMDKVGVLSAGVQAEVKCTVWGSSPPPIVTWSLAGTLLPSAKPWVSDDGNRSVSMVSFTPQPRHDGTQLDCSAHNPVILGDTPHLHPPADHRHSTVLTVNYAPRVSVSLGRNLDATNIKEGDDLYFECTAIAKPPPHKVTWSHNQGGQLESSAGVLVSNMTLVLQKVARSNAGTYTCHATNTEGSTASPPLTLDVKYAPVCASDKVSQHSVAKHENARISCNVLANPPIVNFSWAFNNTAEAVNVPKDRYIIVGTESVVNYTPVTELDYGTLLCWAKNDIGTQIHPCVFQIVAAGKPDPPHNCRAYDVTISSLQVSCLPGYDGGLGQTFILKVLEANGDYKEVVEVSRDSASFSVANLRPATTYRLLVTATNAKGESRPAELPAYTAALNHPQHETPAEPTRGRESGAEVAVGVLVGAVLACLPVAIAVVVMGVRTCMRLRAARRGRGEAGEKDAPDMETGPTGRPLLTGQGTPGSALGGSAESASDITTITGGVALSTTTMPPTPSSIQSDTQVTQVAATDTSSLLYPGSRIYSPDRAQEVVGPQVLTATTAPLRRTPFSTLEEKFEGDNELMEITLPPPAAYDQGYQSSYPGCQPLDQRYQLQEHGPQRLKQNYPKVFHDYQPVLPGGHLPTPGYPSVAIKGGHPSLQYISSVAIPPDYHFPSKDQVGASTKVSTSSPYATLPHSKITASSSFATLPTNKDANPENRIEDSKMSTVYNPLSLFASSPTYAQKCGTAAMVGSERALNTGSLKRGVKPQGQDVLRIRDNSRNRSASLSSVTSKRESSV